LRLDVVDRLLETHDLVLVRFLFELVERFVHDAFGGPALAALEDLVHELRHERAAVHGVSYDLAFGDRAFPRQLRSF